ncbi:MAG: hypothetical protein ACFFAQ_08450 [Promethearchaeota archaeon]
MDFSISGNLYMIPGPTVLLYFPNRKIIKRLYSVTVLSPDMIIRKMMPAKIPSNTPTIIPISEISIPP